MFNSVALNRPGLKIAMTIAIFAQMPNAIAQSSSSSSSRSSSVRSGNGTTTTIQDTSTTNTVGNTTTTKTTSVTSTTDANGQPSESPTMKNSKSTTTTPSIGTSTRRSAPASSRIFVPGIQGNLLPNNIGGTNFQVPVGTIPTPPAGASVVTVPGGASPVLQVPTMPSSRFFGNSTAIPLSPSAVPNRGALPGLPTNGAWSSLTVPYSR